MPPVKSKPANEACWFQLNIHSSIETFLRWGRTAATPLGIPYLRFEPHVSNLPSTRNWCVSGAFLTAKSLNLFCTIPRSSFLGTFSCSNKLDPQGDSACLW